MYAMDKMANKLLMQPCLIIFDNVFVTEATPIGSMTSIKWQVLHIETEKQYKLFICLFRLKILYK